MTSEVSITFTHIVIVYSTTSYSIFTVL